MAFGADISSALRPGENVVAVRVDNSWTYKERATGQGFQWNDRNFNVNYGGITKNVRLHLTDKLYQTLPIYSNLGTTGQYVWADAFDQRVRAATIHAETQVRNEDGSSRTIGYRVELAHKRSLVCAKIAIPVGEEILAPAAAAGLARLLEILRVEDDLNRTSHASPRHHPIFRPDDQAIC